MYKKFRLPADPRFYSGITGCGFFLLCFLITSLCLGEAEVPLSKPENKEILDYYEKRAVDNFKNNLNRFAYEKLERYDFYLDSLFSQELKDTLSAIENKYLSNSASTRNSISSLNKSIMEATNKKKELQDKYWSLVKKSIISFVAWLIIILALLQFRKRKISKARQRFNETTVQLESIEGANKKSEKISEEYSQYRLSLINLNEQANQLLTAIGEAASQGEESTEWNEISKKSDQLFRTIDLEKRVADSVLEQTGTESNDVAETDINKLCEQYFEVALRGENFTEEFNCQVTRDFEKRLPKIKVSRDAVGSLLLNVLKNAFDSVREQNSKGVKGYQPKVSISTRILPRFLQVRIRDNGTGMKEDILKNASTEFFTTKDLRFGSGLGLFVSNKIINEMHKGEIKIESEAGVSTDVYIKFFI